MQKLSRYVIVSLVSLIAFNANAADVSIRITSVDLARKGQILVQLCLEKDFLVRDCTHQKIQAVTSSVEIITFKGVADGKWAAMAFHDENNNEKLDTNKLGIPIEGTGFSRNAKGQYGPPTFASAAEVIEGKNVELKFRLVY